MTEVRIITLLNTVYLLDFGRVLSSVYSLADAEDEVAAVKWPQITDTILTKYDFRERDESI